MRKNIDYRHNKDLVTIKSRWNGNRTFRGRFLNNERNLSHGIGSILKWRLSGNPQRAEKRAERWNPPVNMLHSLDEIYGDALVWLGHSSFFMQLDGKRFLFDPVFGSIPFVRRESRLPVDPKIFTGIDYLLISHDHYDHLDKKSVRRVLAQTPGITGVCGIGGGEWIAQWGDGTAEI
ncbi:MAG: MBL fold metallo-hydrolase, partial [Rikenellaceae bacterium]|nr:MBL fold metallo-hydrolase [Rikenellaceae bacterium]